MYLNRLYILSNRDEYYYYYYYYRIPVYRRIIKIIGTIGMHVDRGIIERVSPIVILEGIRVIEGLLVV